MLFKSNCAHPQKKQKRKKHRRVLKGGLPLSPLKNRKIETIPVNRGTGPYDPEKNWGNGGRTLGPKGRGEGKSCLRWPGEERVKETMKARRRETTHCLKNEDDNCREGRRFFFGIATGKKERLVGDLRTKKKRIGKRKNNFRNAP